MHDGVGMEERLALTEVIYDELIHAILTMVDRLDLTATKAAADDTVCRHILIFWTYSYLCSNNAQHQVRDEKGQEG